MCDYCKEIYGGANKVISDGSETDSFQLEAFCDGSWRIALYGDQSGRIHYCPMCGRKLMEEKK